MDRKKYLNAISHEQIVMYGGSAYIPLAYRLSYSEKDRQWIHTAELKDTHAAMSLVHAGLDDVKEKE